MSLIFNLLLLAGLAPAVLHAQPRPAGVLVPEFSKGFLPNTIGEGNTSVLRFDIDNSASPVGADDLSFTDNLPAGIVIANPSHASTTCIDAILSAPDGGSVITLSNGRVGSGQTCSVSLHVIGAIAGVQNNVSGDLISSLGISSPASATLTVDPDLPFFGKQFDPSTIPQGGTTTLSFLIASPTSLEQFSFQDVLPPGLEIAAPANVTTTCLGGLLPPTILATPGSGVITVTTFGSDLFPVLDPESSCTISVDVTATQNGSFLNISSSLSAVISEAAFVSGFATAVLDVPANFLVKSFIDDPVPPGGTVTLQFTIQNPSRDDAATDIAFEDDLDAVVAGLAPAEMLPKAACGGTLDFTAGVLSLVGGSLPGGGSCTFSVALTVPVTADKPAFFTNTAGAISAVIDGVEVVQRGNNATDVLRVIPVPVFSKEFIGDVVGAGGTAVLRFTITNTDPESPLTEIAFMDDLDLHLPGLSAPSLNGGPVPIPLTDVCGLGSELTLFDPPDILFPPTVTPPDPTLLVFTGGILESAGSMGDSCTFDVPVVVPVGTPAGVYLNETGDISGEIDTCGDGCISRITGLPASAALRVVAGPQLLKQFTDDPVDPGSAVTLQFTLSLSADSPFPATDISFTDDLAAALPGLAATGLPLMGLCPSGDGVLTGSAGNTFLTFSGASLAPGESCIFDVTLSVPGGAPAGIHTNTTSTVTACLQSVPVGRPAPAGRFACGGIVTEEIPASDDLRISSLFLTKEFTDDPVIPGGSVTLQFTITNDHPTDSASAISFDDPLDPAVLLGLSLGGPLPMAPCGAGSMLTTYSEGPVTLGLRLTGGTLAAGEFCTFSVTLTVPVGALSAHYANTTVDFMASFDMGSPVELDNATDTLVVNQNLLLFRKDFIDDPVDPGSLATLEFTITNLSPTLPIANITFTDDLDAALSGLEAVGLPTANVCGAGSSLQGIVMGNPSSIVLIGGSLPAGGSCTFSITVQVPPGTPFGTIATNRTSQITGSVGDLPVTGDRATANLAIAGRVLFTKSFDGPTAPGGTPKLTFNLQNLDLANPVSNLGFSDDLDAALSGLVATGLPANDVCGAGSQISGSGFLTFTGGSLAAGGSCSFDVDLQVPPNAVPGSYLNITSPLSSAGVQQSGPASDTLSVEPPPTFAKAFAPDIIALGQTSTLIFTIDNTASSVAADSLAFTDNLPAGTVVAAVPGVVNSCGGMITAGAGTGVISLSGGSVAAAGSCTVSVNVTANIIGTLINTTQSLTSSSGNSGTAADTLTVHPPPVFSKQFAVDAIPINGVTTLVFTISNTGSGIPATALNFTDNLPAGVTLSGAVNLMSTCGGMVTAAGGTSIISLSGGIVGAGASCTISVDVTGTMVGEHVNLTENLTSSSGNSGAATDTLTVNPPPVFSKSFLPATILSGFTSSLTFTIDNTASTLPASGLDFTDNLPAGMVLTAAPNPTTTCSGGAFTAVANSTTFSYQGGSVAAGSTCQVRVNVTGTSGGVVLENLSEDLTSSLGNSGAAAASLTVNEHSSQLSATKVAESSSVLTGEMAVFTITINNLGPNPLVEIAVDDPLTPDCNRAPGELPDLNPGESHSYMCTTDPLFEDLLNVATITATQVPVPGGLAPAGAGARVMAMAEATVVVFSPTEAIPALSTLGLLALLALLTGTSVVWLRR